MPTDQEIFNKVAAHLIKQGRQAKANFSCLYRAPDGCKCAIGVLIPDDKYDPRMEEHGIRELIIGFSQENSKYEWDHLAFDLTNDVGNNIDLLRHLQFTHDGDLEFLEEEIGGAYKYPRWVNEDQTFDIPQLKRVLNIVAARHKLEPLHG